MSMSEPAHEHVEPAHTHVQPAPPVATPYRQPRNYGAMAARIVLTLLGAAGLIVGAFLTWAHGVIGVNLTIRSLWQTDFGTNGSFIATVGFVAIVIGLLCVLGLAPRTGWLSRFAGALGIAMFILFTIQVYRAGHTVSDLGVGAWLALAGGIVAMVGGFFGARQVMATTGPTVVED